uniref:NADH-ubiquinone oxidoreductase chain 3 n=1 Tax=Disteniazteca fimbriata TaxID=1216934 RepID=U3KZU3_9CUCU|nr:NADH dehydrogenase subunit 3 [Disteniazteca fimbriata]
MMKTILNLSIVILMIMLILVILVNLISKKSFSDREKSSPFECGFDPHNLKRLPFSLQFFLIAIIFLIFDVEITLLLPIAMTLIYSNPLYYSAVVMLFLVILIWGLFHEWNQGALNWAI